MTSRSTRTTVSAATAIAVGLVAPAALLLAPATAGPALTPDLSGAVPASAQPGSAASSVSASSSAARTLAGATSKATRLVAPSTPPARMCGSSGLTTGPSTAPKGAVVVRPTQNLGNVVAAHRAGTTFWLKPGTYHLGGGEYDQVDPKSHDTIIGSHGVVIDGQRLNHYAFGGTAVDVTLAYLEIKDFGTSVTDDQSQGVVNHDAGHFWTMDHLNVHDDGGAGIFVGTGDVIRNSCLAHNGQYGFSAYAASGVNHVRVVHTEIAGNNTANWEARQPGCGCAGGAKLWAVRDATLKDNWVHGNRGVGLWADTNNTGLLFQGNYISYNTNAGIAYETSYNAKIVANTFLRNALVDGPKEGFPQPALYVSESGSDPRAGKRFGKQFVIGRNRFIDNFSAVALWENANRFAGSPYNSSTGMTTLVNPRVATVKACAANITRKPYSSDCRWKTQNVRVRHNTFVFKPSAMPASCTRVAGCGYVGVFSQWGSLAPFKADVVPDHISFDQHNKFLDNTYQGPWRFMSRELGNNLTWQQWRSHPYAQDAGSKRVALR
jgi:hypothetical protein